MSLDGFNITWRDETFTPDSRGQSIPPTLHAAFESLGFDKGVAVSPLPLAAGYQLGVNEQISTWSRKLWRSRAHTGSGREGDEWTRYEIALSHDLTDLPDHALEQRLSELTLVLH